MTTSEERMRILQMVQEGRLTAEEAARLLEVLEGLRRPAGAPVSPAGMIPPEKPDIEQSHAVLPGEIGGLAGAGLPSGPISTILGAQPGGSPSIPEAQPKESRSIPEVQPKGSHSIPEAQPDGSRSIPEAQPRGPRWFRVHITDTNTGRTRVNVRLPISVVSAGIKMGARFSPEVEGLDPARLMGFINSGEMGRVMDVIDEEDGEHVEVFIE